MIEKNFAGLDGFVWWMGVVENRLDPLNLGRCQVRFLGYHSDSLTDIPTADLPWAVPAHSLNNHTFATPKETDVVFGFFADGASKQFPIMMGIIPGIETNPKNTGAGYHDLRDLQTIRYAPKTVVSRKYNNDGTGIKLGEANTANNEVLETLRYPREHELNKLTISGVTRAEPTSNSVISARQNNLDKDVLTADGISWSEPYPAYNPLYPYNQAIETESGHVFELDDTPRNERISMNHRSGTYWEMYPSGTKVEKVTKSNYQIVMGDDFVHIMGKVYVTMDSDCYIKVLGDVKMEVGNDVSMKVSGKMDVSVKESLNIKAKSLNIDIADDSTLVTGKNQFFTSSGDINTNSKGSIRSSAGGSVDIKSGGNINAQSGGRTNIVGSRINLNSGGSAAAAQSGTAAGLAEPVSRATKNNPTITEEATPVPLGYKIYGNANTLNPQTGYAASKDQYTQTNPQDPDGEKVEPQEPPPPQACNYDQNQHTFINKSQWSIGSKGLSLIKQAEGYADPSGKYGAKPPKPPAGSVKAYPDPATKGQPITIGYGTTGPAVDQTITYDTVIDKAKAEEYLAYAINKKFLPSLKKYVNVDLTQEMVDACLSLMYNIGAGNFAKSTLVKKLNQKDWCGAADQFLVWNKAQGKVLNGLTSRRQAERSLFLS